MYNFLRETARLKHLSSFLSKNLRLAFSLLEKIHSPSILYRSTGIILEGLRSNSEEQLFLFSDEAVDSKKEKLSKCFDNLESRFGKDIVQIGFVKDKK